MFATYFGDISIDKDSTVLQGISWVVRQQILHGALTSADLRSLSIESLRLYLLESRERPHQPAPTPSVSEFPRLIYCSPPTER